MEREYTQVMFLDTEIKESFRIWLKNKKSVSNPSNVLSWIAIQLKIDICHTMDVAAIRNDAKP